MDPKIMRLIALALVVVSAIWIALDFIRGGAVSVSPIRTGILVLAVVMLLLARRRVARG